LKHSFERQAAGGLGSTLTGYQPHLSTFSFPLTKNRWQNREQAQPASQSQDWTRKAMASCLSIKIWKKKKEEKKGKIEMGVHEISVSA